MRTVILWLCFLLASAAACDVPPQEVPADPRDVSVLCTDTGPCTPSSAACVYGWGYDRGFGRVLEDGRVQTSAQLVQGKVECQIHHQVTGEELGRSTHFMWSLVEGTDQVILKVSWGRSGDQPWVRGVQ